MRGRFEIRRGQTAFLVGALAMGIAVPATAAPFDATKKENWGVSVRNTIGSPVAELRFGMSSRLTPGGVLTEPPFGKGSLGLEVSVYPGAAVPPGESKQEKVDFGNEVDFFGDPVLALSQVGFHVFQTGENVARGGPTNMPNIRFEIDPNLNACPAVDYTTMVWVPDGVPAASINQWSSYIDATTDGYWYFTNACVAAATTCTQAGTCTTLAQAKTALNDGGTPPTIYSVLVGKGRDNMWIGAVDGLRLNSTIYDFEEDGVKSRGVGRGGGHDDDDDEGDDE